MDILVQDMSKYFENKKILDNITLHFETNKISVIIGSNGSGKSTLIKCISTLAIPDKGVIKMGNLTYDYSKFKLVRSKIAVLLDGDRQLLQNLTVIQNIKYLLALHGKNFNNVKENVDELLKKFSLNEFKDEVVAKLSRGMKQKVSIICTLAHCSQYIILDEPLIGLDASSIDTLIEILKAQKKISTLIISTHDMSFAKSIGDKFIYINNGKIKNIEPQELEGLTLNNL